LTMQETVSEDVFFCKKAKETGFTVWCDPTIKCDHIGSTVFSLETQAEKNINAVYGQDLLPTAHQDYLKTMNITPKVIYDIGSCVLHWERHARRTWPEAELFLVEANTDVKKLYDKTNQNYHLGVLTDTDYKEIKFYKDPMNLGGNSYYKENTAHYNETHAVHMSGMSLDTIAEKNSWPKPDLIKLDVQGAELDILKGAANILETCSDLILECQHKSYNLGAPLVDIVIEYLSSMGFELISNFHKESVDGDYHFKKKITNLNP